MTVDGFPRPFILERTEDATGVSGTGVVAWGVEFPDGVVALRWKSTWPTSVVFHDKGMEGVRAVHGHGGMTEVVWLDRIPEGWPGVVWEEVLDRHLKQGESTEGVRYILHRLTPDRED